MIRLDKIKKAYADKIILNNVTYHFPQGERIALVGANGQGKTTLLNIISGLESADDGAVIKPRECRLSFLPQSPSDHPRDTLTQECLSGHRIVFDLQQEMERLLGRMADAYTDDLVDAYDQCLKSYQNYDGYQIEGLVEKTLLGLGFKREQLSLSPRTLSGGWRMRLELAKTLVSSPDFLILDEPTNHLDLPTIEWLEEALQDFKGTLLFVSHDKAFLNNLATVVVQLNSGHIQAYPGNFDDFLAQKDQSALSQRAAVDKIQRQKAHMQKFVDRFKAKASKAAQAQSRVKMIERLDHALSGMTTEEAPPRINFPPLPIAPTSKDVITVENLSIGYTKPLLRKCTFTLRRGQRLGIVGANGMGKSTLLKTLSGRLLALGGEFMLGTNIKMGFYTQDAADSLPKTVSVLECLRQQSPGLSDQMSLALLGMFLFKGNDLSKKVGVLSGGERARLALCGLIAQLPNVLFLDEPTNHLDMMTTEIIAEMLTQYKGTVLFISHDRHFMEEVATDILQIETDGKVYMV